MELTDALIITGLGMGVVFTGLLLTSALIVLFAAVPRWLDRAPGGKPAGEAAAGIAPPPPDPVVVAVLLAVIDAERRLGGARAGRLTFSPPRAEGAVHE